MKALQELKRRTVHRQLTAALAKTSLKNIEGLLGTLQQSGFAVQVSSWLGAGKNLAIKSEQLRAALSNDQIQHLAAYFDLPM